MNPVFVSQRLTHQNYQGQCNEAVKAVVKMKLSRMGIAFGSSEALNRRLVFNIHADATEKVNGSTEEKERASWW